MISKSKISLIRSLDQKKYRKQHGLFIAEGKKIILEILDSAKFEVVELFLTSSALKEVSAGKFAGIEVTEISDSELERISMLTTPSFGLALLKIPEEISPVVPKNDEIIVLLDSIRDPGNMGSIVRLCDWFGVSQIICTEDTVDVYSPKVIQASMGSVCRIPVCYTNAAHWLDSVKDNASIYATVMNGKPLQSIKKTLPCVIIIGSESHGVSSQILKFATEHITIESALHSGAESLNAALAAGIVLYEFRR
jgi:RNA methyltransferase, TrmH family